MNVKTAFPRAAATLAGIGALLFSLAARASEANLVLPAFTDQPGRVTPKFFGTIDGKTLLSAGLLVCVLGLGFGLYQYMQLKKLPVHRAMLEISELIYQTCKTY